MDKKQSKDKFLNKNNDNDGKFQINNDKINNNIFSKKFENNNEDNYNIHLLNKDKRNIDDNNSLITKPINDNKGNKLNTYFQRQ